MKEVMKKMLVRKRKERNEGSGDGNEACKGDQD